MTLNEIKKELYKTKPIAKFEFIRKGRALYKTLLNENDEEADQIYFDVPIEDIGDATFYNEMESHLLIRYLITSL